MAAVFGRYGTTPRSFGATFWNPGFKTEKTAKKREKTGQKWARYGLRKRVRVADLFVMDRYIGLEDPDTGEPTDPAPQAIYKTYPGEDMSGYSTW